jgi:SLT domain-containing protein
LTLLFDGLPKKRAKTRNLEQSMRHALSGRHRVPYLKMQAPAEMAAALGWHKESPGTFSTLPAGAPRRLGTYTLKSESGTSLRVAGWRTVGETTARSWSCPARPRVDRAPLQERIRWEMTV